MKVTLKCPGCQQDHVFDINPAQLMANIKSQARSEQARLNGRKGGRPKKVKGDK